MHVFEFLVHLPNFSVVGALTIIVSSSLILCKQILSGYRGFKLET